MTQTLTVEISDSVYDEIRRHAEGAGQSPSDVAAETLERRFGCIGGQRVRTLDKNHGDAEAARQRFERHFGEVDLGYPTGSDNEAIDADLAREFADTHEGG